METPLLIIELRIRIDRGYRWTWFEDSKRFVMMILRNSKNSKVFPPNRLVRKAFFDYLLGIVKLHRAQNLNRQGIDLFERCKMVCFDDLLEALKYLPRKPSYFSKSVFVDVL